VSSEREQGPVLVDSAIFRVESDGRIYWVMEEKTMEGDSRLVCTCVQKYSCRHIEAVRKHLARYGGAGSPAQEKKTPLMSEHAFRDSYPTLPPSARKGSIAPMLAGMVERKKDKGLFGDPESLERAASALRNLVEGILSVKIEDGRESLRRITDEVLRSLEGIRATDLLKSVSALRRSVLEEKPDPVEVCTDIERVMGALHILESHRGRLPVDERLQTTYLGRAREIDEVEAREDVHLVEIARNSVLTPFKVRRSESYYFCTGTGELFIEEKYHLPGEGNPSVGPFPRSLRVNLMTIEPRLGLPAVSLLQYAVLPPPNEGDLLRIKTKAIGIVEAAVDLYKKVVGAAGSPYPVFVTFAPLKAQIHCDRLIMRDSDGDIIGLAYSSAPYGCLAAERICVRNHLHAVCGLLVREGKYMALSPLSLLIENGTGLKMMRIT
jgi:hypothetical protein